VANYSELTRKQQVRAYLVDHHDTWVDGTEIMNERVGGQRGGARIWDLRHQDGLTILERKHPDPNRDIHQYMLVMTASGAPPATPGPAAAPLCPICKRELGAVRETVSDAFAVGKCIVHGWVTIKR